MPADSITGYLGRRLMDIDALRIELVDAIDRAEDRDGERPTLELEALGAALVYLADARHEIDKAYALEQQRDAAARLDEASA